MNKEELTEKLESLKHEQMTFEEHKTNLRQVLDVRKQKQEAKQEVARLENQLNNIKTGISQTQ